MCGITGLIQKTNKKSLDKLTILNKLSEAIHHRGPDDYAYFTDATCVLGMRRLAIVDLTPGLYPMYSNDKSKVLMFNGEIYNFLELRHELESKGRKFKSNCDAEVIIVGYEEWGNLIFSKLRGMFAIAIWHKDTNKLILVRDRIGIKPLYYIDNEDLFAFSSEAKALYSLVPSELNRENVKLLMGFMFLPKSDETIVKGVKKLPPATILELQDGHISMSTYWNIGDHSQNLDITYADAVDKLDNILTESIKIHLMSDVPIGVLLSGGVDSSLISAILTKKLNIEVDTYTAKFDHKFDESSLAQQTAGLLGTKHNEVFVDTSDINNNIENYVSAFDDLSTFDGGIISTKILCEQIQKKGIKVLLLGEGADEILGGYSWYGLSQMPFNLFPPSVRNMAYYYSISRNLSYEFYDYSKYWNNSYKNTPDIFRNIAEREITLQLPNHLLMKVDKGSMSHSIEARVPYLDHALVEFVHSLPKEFKLHGSWFNGKMHNEKYILRSVAKRYLPQTTAIRKKKGFMLPMHDVLYKDIDKVKSYILDKDSINRNLLGDNFVENLFNTEVPKFIAMQKEYFLWRIFILEVWAKHYQFK